VYILLVSKENKTRKKIPRCIVVENKIKQEKDIIIIEKDGWMGGKNK